MVTENSKLKIEKLVAEEGQEVEFDVLLSADGDNVEIGTPVLAKKLKGKVIKQGRSRKVIGIKYKPKTREHTKFGHRQAYSEVEFSKI